MPTSLNMKFATETNLADGKLVEVLENWELILKLGTRSQKPVASKDVGQLFYLNKHVCKIKMMMIIIIIVIIQYRR